MSVHYETFKLAIELIFLLSTDISNTYTWIIVW